MFSTSHDILNLVLSISVAALTIFICLGLYYIIASFRQIFKAVNRIQEVIEKIDSICDFAKNKLQQSGTYIGVALEFAKKAMEFVKEKKEARAEKKANK